MGSYHSKEESYRLAICAIQSYSQTETHIYRLSPCYFYIRILLTLIIVKSSMTKPAAEEIMLA